MYWLVAIIGLVAIIAPFVFGYSNNAWGLGTSLIIGVGLLAVAVSKLFSGETRYRHLH